MAVDSLPENDEACGELLLELVDYLPKRYPTLFRRDGPDGITNLVTGEQYLSLGSKKGTDALMVISRCVLIRSRGHPAGADSAHSLVQDDFLMGREREDGKIYLVGGLIAFPGAPHPLFRGGCKEREIT